jgi:hypothetical protein
MFLPVGYPTADQAKRRPLTSCGAAVGGGILGRGAASPLLAWSLADLRRDGDSVDTGRSRCSFRAVRVVEKQKENKRRMKMVVEIPQAAFVAVLKTEDEDEE